MIDEAGEMVARVSREGALLAAAGGRLLGGRQHGELLAHGMDGRGERQPVLEIGDVLTGMRTVRK